MSRVSENYELEQSMEWVVIDRAREIYVYEEQVFFIRYYLLLC